MGFRISSVILTKETKQGRFLSVSAKVIHKTQRGTSRHLSLLQWSNGLPLFRSISGTILSILHRYIINCEKLDKNLHFTKKKQMKIDLNNVDSKIYQLFFYEIVVFLKHRRNHVPGESFHGTIADLLMQIQQITVNDNIRKSNLY